MSTSAELDAQYPTYRAEFVVPTFGSLGIKNSAVSPDTETTYFCGNSLGLMPKRTRAAVTAELDAWGQRGVEAHFNHPGSGKTDWVDIDLPVVPLIAPLVGALETEVAVMGSLTANLNALLMYFYRPSGQRTKILFEKHAFPSDYYAFLNVVKLFGYDESHLIQLEVNKARGDSYLSTDDILRAVDENKDQLALVCFPGIQYYTGQLFEIEKISRHIKTVDLAIVVGWDLAHAVGNVVLKLHDWDIDFAAWCNYKYVNSGPGAIGGIFVNEKHTRDNTTANFKPRLAGWWGNNGAERFKMLEKFDPIASALSYRQSNPSVLDVVAVQASLEVFQLAGGVSKLREKSRALTQYLQDLLTSSRFYSKDGSGYGFQILTPLDPEHRGAQLSLLFTPHYEDKKDNVMEQVNTYLHDHGIICDERRPDVIRVAPAPLYNTFAEVEYVVKTLNEALEKIQKK